MNTAETRLLNENELQAKLLEAEREYATSREAVVAGKEKNHARLRGLRRDVARLKTICQEKNLHV